MLEGEQWQDLQQVFLAEKLEETGLEPSPLMEKLLATLLKEVSALPDEMDKKISQVGLTAANVLRAVCYTSLPEIKAAATAIAACFSLKPLQGQSTLEEPLGLLMSSEQKPIYRIIHETAVGSLLLNQAATANQKLMAKRDAQLSLAECQHTFDQMIAQNVVGNFIDTNEDQSLHTALCQIDQKLGLLNFVVSCSFFFFGWTRGFFDQESRGLFV